MNIKDLPAGSYQPVATPKLNINSLPKGSVQPVSAPVASAPTTRNALSSTPVLGQLSNAGIGAGTAIAKTLTGIPEAISRGIGGALGGLAKIGPQNNAGQKGLSGLGNQFVHNADKIAQYKEDQFTKPYQSSLETVSGQAGNIAGNVAPYFLTGGAAAAAKAPLLARVAAAIPSVLADTAISQAQSGGDLATGGATALTSLVGNTIVPGGGGLGKRMLKGAVPGYTGDVAMGMAGQRGEDRKGASAFVPGLGTALGAGFAGAGYIKSPERKAVKAQKTIKGREAVLQRLEDNYASIKKVTENASKRGIDPKKMLAGGDLLVGSVDNAGTIRTTGEGGAIEQLNNFIKPQEGIISKKLQQEGAAVPLTVVHKKLQKAVMDSGLQGGALTRALQNVESDIAGYAIRADKSGNIPLATVHSAKVDKYANINYLNPESKRADKVIAKTLKTIVEDNSSVEVKKLNEELSRHYATLSLLEKLDGKKVEGGRLGKLFAQTIGGMVGSHFGPLGTIAGAEIGGAAKGAMMKSTFGKKTGSNLAQSELMKKNIQSTETALGMRNQSQSNTRMTTSPTGITPTVLPKAPKPKPVVPITEPSRLLAEPRKVTSLGGETIAGKVDASGSLIPHEGGKSGVKLVPAEKGMVGVDPKTKRFMRTYKSGFASKTAINTLGGAATGALAGVETDQNGKKTYNLKKGLGGAALGGALGYGVSKGKLGLSMEDITRDYDTVAKALQNYDTSSPTLNFGKGNKMAAPLSEDASMLADLKAKLETGVLTKEEIATAGKLLQKEGVFAKASPLPQGGVTPKTVKVWNKSKFSNNGAYAEVPVVRREDGITLYQGGSSEGRQFWTPDKKYASQFGEVKEKTGSFYKIDNGNQMTDVYVEAPVKSANPLIAEAKKYKTAEDFVKAQGETLYHGTQSNFESFDLAKSGTRNPADQGFAGRGIYFTNSKEVANTFANGRDIFPSKNAPKDGIGKVIDAHITVPESKILSVNSYRELYEKLGFTPSQNRPANVGLIQYINEHAPKIREKAQQMGYDAIRVDGGGKDSAGIMAHEIVVFDPKNIKTRSQLTEIWKKAHSQ